MIKLTSDFKSSCPLPVISKSEQFFEWKPQMIRYLHEMVPMLQPWLPNEKNLPYPNGPIPPVDPGMNIPEDAIFLGSAVAADREFAKQNLEIFKFRKNEFTAYNQAKIRCSQIIDSSMIGEFREKIRNNNDYVAYERAYNFQMMWVVICESHKLKGKLLRDEQETAYQKLKDVHQSGTESLEAYNTRFEKALKYMKEIDIKIDEVKKADLYLNGLNSRFQGLRESYLSNEYVDSPDFVLQKVKDEANKWDLSTPSRNLSSTYKFASSNSSLVENAHEINSIDENFFQAKAMASVPDAAKASINATKSIDDIPRWLAEKLTATEYNSLSQEKKELRNAFQEAKRNRKMAKMKCHNCGEVGHYAYKCEKPKKYPNKSE